MMNRVEVPLAQLSFTQKLDLMETLWADMSSNEKNLEPPVWHEEILNDREAALWEKAKERIKKNIS